MPTFVKPTNHFSRLRDHYGSGQYNSSRDGGKRHHQGLDVIAHPGERIMSPIKGILSREANPYKGDPTYKGVLIKGVEEFAGIEVKLFYVIVNWRTGIVQPGDMIGIAQDLSFKYPGITNHVHMEVLKFGQHIDPTSVFPFCF